MKEVVAELAGIVAEKNKKLLNEEKMVALVIDDMLMERKIREQRLLKIGCKVDLAESGDAALLLVETKAKEGKAYPIICCDYNMPGMNGAQVVCDIKKREEYKYTIIWCVTTETEKMKNEIYAICETEKKNDEQIATIFESLRFSSKDPLLPKELTQEKDRKWSAPVELEDHSDEVFLNPSQKTTLSRARSPSAPTTPTLFFAEAEESRASPEESTNSTEEQKLLHCNGSFGGHH